MHLATSFRRQAESVKARRSKYGTGFASIHQREAPQRVGSPLTLLLNHSAKETFRERANRSRTVALRQTCCARQKIASHSSVLFVGDSQLQAVYEFLCEPKKAKSKSHMQVLVAVRCAAKGTLLTFVVSAG